MLTGTFAILRSESHHINLNRIYRWEFRLLVENKKKVLKQKAAEQGFEINDAALLNTCKPINIVLTHRLDESVREELLKNFPKMHFTGIDYHMENLAGEGISYFVSFYRLLGNYRKLCESETMFFKKSKINSSLLLSIYSFALITLLLSIVVSSATIKPTNKVTECIDVIRRTMIEQHCGINHGSVYRKITQATKTYILFKSVKNYLLGLLENTDIANCLAPLLQQVLNLYL